MKVKRIIGLAIGLLSGLSQAATISNPEKGYSFEAPSGWAIARNEELFTIRGSIDRELVELPAMGSSDAGLDKVSRMNQMVIKATGACETPVENDIELSGKQWAGIGFVCNDAKTKEFPARQTLYLTVDHGREFLFFALTMPQDTWPKKKSTYVSLMKSLQFEDGSVSRVTTMQIPDQGWHVSFDAPRLAKQKESDQPGQYMYFGNAGTFNLSLYVEDPSCSGGVTHKDFYDCFWPQASRNPTIVTTSVVATSNPRYYKVAYESAVPWKGQVIKQKSINFLFVYRGKWSDLHVSVVEPTSQDLRMLENFEKSLNYGPDK